MRSKNILHISGQSITDKFAGLERWYCNNAKNLYPNKIYLSYCEDIPKDIKNKFEENNVSIVKINTEFNFANIIRFIFFLTKNRIDIVHGHFDGPINFLVIAKLMGCKSFWHVHMGNYYFSNKNWTRSLKLRIGFSYYRIVMFIKHLFFDKIFYVSKAILSEHRDINHYTNSKCKVLYLGLDKNILDKYEEKGKIKRDENGLINITTIAFLEDIKGIDVLLKAAFLLKEKYQFQINIIGASLNEKENKYEHLVQQLGLNILVKFWGKQNNVFDFLEKTHIYCQPSRSEALPISIMEAMALGLPIVASNVGGIPELVSSNVNGYLFESENETECAECLQKLIENETLRNEFGKNSFYKIRDTKLLTEENIKLLYKYY